MCRESNFNSTYPCILPNQPLKVMVLVWFGANNLSLSCAKWSIQFFNMHVAHMNGYCEGICVSTKLWLFSHASITQVNIIKYCGTWYGFDCRRLAPMFVDLWHIPYDGDFSNDGDDEFIKVDEGINAFIFMIHMQILCTSCGFISHYVNIA